MAKIKVKLKDCGDCYVVTEGPIHLLGMVASKHKAAESTNVTNKLNPFILDPTGSTRVIRHQSLTESEVTKLRREEIKHSCLPE
jgi:hypothetical protein